MTTLTGYAAIFDRADSQADVIAPGAFRTSLDRRADRMPLLWQHDLAEPIGRVAELREDRRGLWFSADLSPTRRAADAIALIRGGATRECSIGFLPRRVRYQDHGGRRLRVIHELELIEISLVTLAANPLARVLTLDGLTLGARLLPTATIARRRLRAAIPMALPDFGATARPLSTPSAQPPGALRTEYRTKENRK